MENSQSIKMQDNPIINQKVTATVISNDQSAKPVEAKLSAWQNFKLAFTSCLGSSMKVVEPVIVPIAIAADEIIELGVDLAVRAAINEIKELPVSENQKKVWIEFIKSCDENIDDTMKSLLNAIIHRTKNPDFDIAKALEEAAEKAANQAATDINKTKEAAIDVANNEIANTIINVTDNISEQIKNAIEESELNKNLAGVNIDNDLAKDLMLENEMTNTKVIGEVAEA